MSARRRWTNVRGTENRIYEPLERLAVGAFDLPGRAWAALRGASPGLPLDPDEVREVLVLRLDRIGDVVMSLPALADLRRALPDARIRLAVGRWSADVARSAPVDEVIEWSAPWVGRRSEGADGFGALCRRALGLRGERLDLAIDLQGDVRASLLMWLSAARARAGYANTGGAWMLTHVVPLDEDVSWVEQNRLALDVALGPRSRGRVADPLTAAERAAAAELLGRLGLGPGGPRIGIHPSGGRLIKQWPAERWAEVGARLQREFGARVVITGSGADAALAADVAARLPERPTDLAGRLSVRETLAVVEQLDLYLSPDTGTMHLACLVGTPTVSVFGPSDPGRYFFDFEPAERERHVVCRPDLWCAPCNLIRKPPAECANAALPECLDLVGVGEVHAAAARLLKAGGFAPRA